MMVRAFVALEISDEIKKALMQAQGLLRTCAARLTFVDPALIHITVRFLGEVKNSEIDAVIDALKTIRIPPFPVRAVKVTVNNPRRPFTVWCTIDDGGNGARLSRMIDDVLAPIGFLRDNRPFSAHATVARIKRFDPSLMDILRQLGEQDYGICTVNGMKLKKSTLTPQGPVYEDLLEVAW